jgi:uncharacterized protein with HEPN domain
MSRDSLRLADYLDHILDAIERISTYCADIDEVSFLSNKMLQDAVIRNFEVIGEASHNILKLQSSFLQEHPDVPLLFAYEMRNALAHGYHRVDLEIVWTTINRHLTDLRDQIVQIRAQMSADKM